MKIALLEDNPAIIDYVQMTLEMDEYDVDIFNNGAELLNALFEEDEVHSPLPYGLLLLDVLLPGRLSGIEVARRVRKHISSEVLPIVIMSGGTSQREFDMIEKELDVLTFRKPFRMSDLLALIEKLG